MTTSMNQPALSKMPRGKGPRGKRQRRDLLRARMIADGRDVPPLHKRAKKTGRVS